MVPNTHYENKHRHRIFLSGCQRQRRFGAIGQPGHFFREPGHRLAEPRGIGGAQPRHRDVLDHRRREQLVGEDGQLPICL